MLIIISFLALALLFPSCHGAGWTPSSLPVVILRMDDVQVRTCEEMTKAAVDAVIAKDVPISLSLIAKGFDLSVYAKFAAYIRSVAANSLVEIASHSYSHQSYTENNLDWQRNDLISAQSLLSGVTGVLPTTFTPPLNLFDSDTLEALLSVPELKIFSSKCVWNQNIRGQVTDCDSPAAVTAPDIFRAGSYQLPAGAVLGGSGYWSNKLQPGNLTEAVKRIETQILNQNFSVVLLNPAEFSTSTECVSVDADKIALLESLIDYGAGKWQFMTFQEAAIHFTNDTTLFAAAEERGDRKFEYQAKLNLAVVFVLTACVLCVACLSFCRTSTEQKIQRKDRIAAELKRKKDIESKLKTQRVQRDLELTGNAQTAAGARDKKKINKAQYSMI
jgi:peptidoglycan/xylan/chitin deacetylase (PgdA/CDA1 family)